MVEQECNYGWKDADPTSANLYILPAVMGILRSCSGKEKLQVIDLGCGNGYVGSRIAELGHSVVGIDASPDGLAIAKSKYPTIRFELGSIYDKDLPERAG